MAKRKGKRTAKHKDKRKHKGPAHSKADLQRPGLYSLPDHVIEEILHWTRPEDYDQSIWQWVCRISATCAAFRHVICSVKPGGVALTPTRLAASSNIWAQQDLLSLMNTIRQSHWMGTNIKLVSVEWNYSCPRAHAEADVLRSLLTTPGRLPNLTKVRLNCAADRMPILVNHKSFLRELPRVHPGLTELALSSGVLGDNSQDYLSPCVFARLASSLPNLECFDISKVSWMGSSHLVAFFSNLRSKLTSLLLSGGSRRNGFADEVFASIAAHCHNLDALHVLDCSFPSRPFASVLRSNRNLLRVDVRGSYCDNARIIFDSIVEHVPGLRSFKGGYCGWVDDEGIRTLINGQINAFGRVLLKELSVDETGVSIHGMRSIFTRWREIDHALPIAVCCSWWHLEDPDIDAMEAIENDFPEFFKNPQVILFSTSVESLKA